MRISVITICYNAETTIKKTMESVLSQKFTDMEYLIVDGKSTDKTNDIVEEMREKFEKVGISLIHISEKDKGISDAFNKGVRKSNGEIVCIINSGDMLNEGALKKVDKEFDDNTDVLYGNMIWDDKANNLYYVRKSENTNKMLPYRMACLHPATFIKKSAYDEVGLYKVDFVISMDREILCRMKLAGKRFKYVDFEFAIAEAGGVSDQKKQAQRRIEEGKIIAAECGISKPVYAIYTWGNQVTIGVKSFLKKNTGIYRILKKPAQDGKSI